MNCKERRKFIENCLKNSKNAVKGQEIAKNLNVTRQVIVKDIAILRAEGKNILATPQGYMIYNASNNGVLRVLAVCHDVDKIQEELVTIVKFGGQVLDVIVEHPVYGEMKGMIMVKSMYDIEKFMEKLKGFKAEPLLVLTAGVHLHTIEATDQDAMERIVSELKKINVLLSSEDKYEI